MEEFMLIFFLAIVGLIIKSFYDQKKEKEKRFFLLSKEWGEVPSQEYSSEKLVSLGKYYQEHRRENKDIDDITWNDLDMNQIFMTINNTQSAAGEEILYSLLRKPEYNKEILNHREQIISFFQKNENTRKEIQIILSQMGKMNEISIYEYIKQLGNVKKDSTLLHILHMIAFPLSFLLCFIEPKFGVVATILVISTNMITYYKRKSIIEQYLKVVSYIIRLVSCSENLLKIKCEPLKTELNCIRSSYQQFQSFVKNSWLVTSKSISGGFVDMILEYVRIFFHIDLIKFNKMLDTFTKYQKDLIQTFELLGFIDAMIATASFRELCVNYCIPELEATKHGYLHAEEMYHPMIEQPVKNTIITNKSVLITGSNASGKSTFIKTLAINAVLAQSIHTVMANRYEASFFKVISSMALRDNLLGKESYYIVEIKSLKRIIDSIEETIPTLCFVDEVLRGTNTLERIAASSRILYSLSLKNTLCFAATHDIELTHILKAYFDNYHFEEQVEDNNVLFDYKLHKGRAVSRNAIKLLRMLGFDLKIVNSAKIAADEFQESGEWKTI